MKLCLAALGFGYHRDVDLGFRRMAALGTEQLAAVGSWLPALVDPWAIVWSTWVLPRIRPQASQAISSLACMARFRDLGVDRLGKLTARHSENPHIYLRDGAEGCEHLPRDTSRPHRRWHL